MKLSIAVVSYNARDDLKACLDSIVETTTGDAPEVIVADNASTDESVAMMRERFPGVGVIELGDNVGFSRACNAAWKRTSQPLVLFLNSDTVVPPGALGRMVSLLNARPDVGAIGPLLHNTDGTVQMSHGRMMSLLSEMRQKLLDAGYGNGHGPLRRYVDALHRSERDVDWVSGACLLTRREVLEKIDGFDETFFLYSEDVDLCARIRGLGLRILFTPDVTITHHRGRSASADRERVFVESQRSRLHFYAKHYGQPHLGLLKLYMTTKLVLAYLFRPSARESYRRVLELVFHGDSA